MIDTGITLKSVIVAQYANAFSELRDIVCDLVDDLKEFSKIPEPLNEVQQAKWNWRFGKKENILTAKIKLTSLLTKIMVMDLKIIDINAELNPQKDRRELEPNEIAMMERYRQKMIDAGLSGDELLFYEDGKWVK
jgi:hypothetical protein